LEVVLAFLVQFGGIRFHPGGRTSLLAPLVLIVFVMCAGAIVVPVLGFVVSGSRGALRAWRARRRRRRAALGAELRARALMSELCPHGWRAEIKLVQAPGEDPEEWPAPVALDWTELGDESGRPAVVRRVWAQTIGEALDAMVADRRTDETLEQIEQRAVADGALWPDL
jgi:hypothetical protein